MTKAELCRRWNKGPKTIQRYAASGMPYSGTGHNLRFDIAECEAWRAEHIAARAPQITTTARTVARTIADPAAPNVRRCVQCGVLYRRDLAAKFHSASPDRYCMDECSADAAAGLTRQATLKNRRAEFKASGWTEAELREGDAFDWVGPTYAG